MNILLSVILATMLISPISFSISANAQEIEIGPRGPRFEFEYQREHHEWDHDNWRPHEDHEYRYHHHHHYEDDDD